MNMQNINIKQSVKFGLIGSIIIGALSLINFLETVYYMFDYGGFGFLNFFKVAAKLGGHVLIILFFHSFNLKVNGTK